MYIQTVGSSPTLRVDVFSDAAGLNLVAQSSSTLANNDPFVAAPANASGLTVSGTLGTGPTGTLITFDMEFFKADSDNGNAPDRFEFAVSLTTEGFIQEVFGEIFTFELNETTLGGETISDGKLRRGGINTGIEVMQ